MPFRNQRGGGGGGAGNSPELKNSVLLAARWVIGGHVGDPPLTAEEIAALAMNIERLCSLGRTTRGGGASHGRWPLGGGFGAPHEGYPKMAKN